MGFQLPGQARMADVAQAITEAALRPPEPPPTLLYTPFQLGADGGGLTLPNRVKLAAMTTGFASPEGLPSERLIAWYAARAAGGVGLVTVEGARVAPGWAPGSGSRFVQHRLRLDGDDCVPAYLPLTEAIHRAGARAALQLTAPGVRDAEALLALPAEEIAELARAFGTAAGRARRAGFDAVEVQCTYRSLFAQLLSRATNRRRDRYGRGPGGRLRAVREALGAIREEAGADFPVLVKYSADEYLPRGIRLEGPGGGLAIGKALEVGGERGAGGGESSRLAGRGAGQQTGAPGGARGLEVLAGAVASDAQLRFSAGVGEAVLADLAQRVKEVVRAPVLAAGRILTGDGAEAVLRGGQADLLTVGRALLADPAWLAKTRAGLELEVAPCIGCMACYTPAPDGGIGCPVNGEAGQEHLPPLPGVAAPRRVAVLGASLAGLEVARVAASRGHEVTLATDGLPLGGLLGLRAGVPGNAEFGRAFLYLGDRLVELGVSIADASPEEVAAEAEVTVDCRAGAERRPGWASRGQGVFPAGDILGRELHQMYGIGRRVAVAGPGALAAEVALFLAGWGRRPTVIVPGPEEDPFPDVHPMHAARLRERLEGYKVPLVTGATPVAWKFDPQRKSELVVRRAPAAGRTARRQGGRTKGAAEGEEALGPFQSVVTAEGWAPPAGQRSRVEGGSQGREGSVASGEENRWPQAVFGLQAPDGVPDGVPSGARLVLGDTPFVEPLRDLVQYAHLLGRTL